MDMKLVRRISGIAVSLFSMGMMFGCAHYEKNNGHGAVPGYLIRTDMQDADRAVEAARQAGKDRACPAEFDAAEAAKNNAYDVYRACHTEEGSALARKATAMANALCPPVAAAAPAEPPPPPIAAAVPTPQIKQYCNTLNIEFDIDRAVIRTQYHDEVGKVGEFMKKYPTTTAVIEGNTDDVGDDDYNMKLSLRRAESVVKYLTDNFGIDASRLSAKGNGKTKPITDNKTDAGRQKNRRIDAIIDCALDVKDLPQPPEQLCMLLNVQFDTDSAAIKSNYHDEINKVADFLKKYPTTTAVIEGHTDNVGGAAHNMKLSQQRAESVVNYLVEKGGIDRSRLSAKGYGDTRRIAYNNTAEGRQKNRRINAIIDCVVAK